MIEAKHTFIDMKEQETALFLEMKEEKKNINKYKNGKEWDREKFLLFTSLYYTCQYNGIMNALQSYGSTCVPLYCWLAFFFFLSCLHCARVLLIRFKGIFSFFHLCSMTDSCLLICVHECLQYPHYLHMIIVTINLRCRFLFYLPSVCEFSKFVYKIHNLNAWLEFFVRWISRKK